MRFETDFPVERPRDEVLAILDRDETVASFFPDTRVTRRQDGARETLTRASFLGQTRDVRFVFTAQPEGGLRFSKICDGNVWRSLDGEVRIEGAGAERSRVRIWMEGRTRPLVPEFSIRGPLRDQLERFAKGLRTRLEAG